MTGSFLSFIARILISLRYSVKISGIRTVSSKGKKGILFLPNHPALIDPVITVTKFFPEFRPLVLADRDQVDFPVLRKSYTH
jgi:long-chain-fatty-acid--[acyl-carrier-protein] ligase